MGFQYKLLNDIVFTNKKQFRFKMIDLLLCSFCKKEVKSLKHLQLQWTVTEGFWKVFTSWKLHKFRSSDIKILIQSINDRLLYWSGREKNPNQPHNYLRPYLSVNLRYWESVLFFQLDIWRQAAVPEKMAVFQRAFRKKSKNLAIEKHFRPRNLFVY